MGLFSAWRATGRHAHLVRQAPHPALREYLATPLPPRSLPLDDVPFLALDIETSGLDPANSALLSVGFVPVHHGTIELSGARSYLVADAPTPASSAKPATAAPSRVGQSAVVHRLTDDQLDSGEPVAEVLAAVFSALVGRVLLAHYAALEVAFLRAAARQVWGVAPDILAADTMAVQAGLIAPGFDDEPRRDELRLWTARRHFGLPAARAHSAAGDAIACAELFLAQSAELARRRSTHPPVLRHVLA